MRHFIFLFMLWVQFLPAQEGPKIDAILNQFDTNIKPGMSILVSRNGAEVYNRSFGLANLEHSVKNSDTTKFSLASVAKQFTAACIWSLEKEGKISLDDDIRKFVPELPLYEEPIKIRHLLNHTSGLRNYHTLMELSGFDYDSEYYDNQTVLHLAMQQKALNNRPGNKVLYGNTAYTLLAIIIERASGQNLKIYAKEKLFDRLGMRQTGVVIENNSIIRNRATGYLENRDGSFSHFPRIQKSYGAGSMYSTLKDMVIWSSVFTDPPQGFEDLGEWLAKVEKLPDGTTPKYARGVMTDLYKGRRIIHHSGYGIGGQSQVLIFPDEGLSLVILTNLESINPVPVSYKIADIFFNEKTESSSNKTRNVSSKKLNRYVGQYQEIGSDMRMEILIENDTLKAKGAQSKIRIPLVALSENQFYRKSSQNIVYEFVTAKDYDMSVTFGGAPFYFSRAVFIDPKSVSLQQYTGKFHSEELNVDYVFKFENNQLTLTYRNHENIVMIPGQADEFGNSARILYRFTRDLAGKVNGLIVSAEGTVKDIRFSIQE